MIEKNKISYFTDDEFEWTIRFEAIGGGMGVAIPRRRVIPIGRREISFEMEAPIVCHSQATFEMEVPILVFSSVQVGEIRSDLMIERSVMSLTMESPIIVRISKSKNAMIESPIIVQKHKYVLYIETGIKNLKKRLAFMKKLRDMAKKV